MAAALLLLSELQDRLDSGGAVTDALVERFGTSVPEYLVVVDEQEVGITSGVPDVPPSGRVEVLMLRASDRRRRYAVELRGVDDPSGGVTRLDVGTEDHTGLYRAADIASLDAASLADGLRARPPAIPADPAATPSRRDGPKLLSRRDALFGVGAVGVLLIVAAWHDSGIAPFEESPLNSLAIVAVIGLVAVCWATFCLLRRDLREPSNVEADEVGVEPRWQVVVVCPMPVEDKEHRRVFGSHEPGVPAVRGTAPTAPQAEVADAAATDLASRKSLERVSSQAAFVLAGQLLFTTLLTGFAWTSGDVPELIREAPAMFAVALLLFVTALALAVLSAVAGWRSWPSGAPVRVNLDDLHSVRAALNGIVNRRGTFVAASTVLYALSLIVAALVPIAALQRAGEENADVSLAVSGERTATVTATRRDVPIGERVAVRVDGFRSQTDTTPRRLFMGSAGPDSAGVATVSHVVDIPLGVAILAVATGGDAMSLPACDLREGTNCTVKDLSSDDARPLAVGWDAQSFPPVAVIGGSAREMTPRDVWIVEVRSGPGTNGHELASWSHVVASDGTLSFDHRLPVDPRVHSAVHTTLQKDGSRPEEAVSVVASVPAERRGEPVVLTSLTPASLTGSVVIAGSASGDRLRIIVTSLRAGRPTELLRMTTAFAAGEAVPVEVALPPADTVVVDATVLVGGAEDDDWTACTTAVDRVGCVVRAVPIDGGSIDVPG